MTVPVVSVEDMPSSVTHAGSSMLTKPWGTVILGKAFGDIRPARVNDMPENRPDVKNGYRGAFLAKLQKDDFSVLSIGKHFAVLFCKVSGKRACLYYVRETLRLIAFPFPDYTKG